MLYQPHCAGTQLPQANHICLEFPFASKRQIIIQQLVSCLDCFEINTNPIKIMLRPVKTRYINTKRYTNRRRKVLRRDSFSQINIEFMKWGGHSKIECSVATIVAKCQYARIHSVFNKPLRFQDNEKRSCEGIVGHRYREKKALNSRISRQ